MFYCRFLKEAEREVPYLKEYTFRRDPLLEEEYFNKKCLTQTNCVISEKKGAINNELKTKILKTAALYEAEKKLKDNKPYKGAQ